MSHSKLRSEKTCLNCGARLYDRYCHKCGQENVEPKQSLWHLIVHFFNDVTHFDGKFFSTLKLLLFKPGFLSKEYVQGRRVSYLDPVRMYIFISTVFFIALLSVLPPPHYVSSNEKLSYLIDSMRKVEYTDGLSITRDDIRGYDITVLNVDEDFRHGYKHYDSLKEARKESRSFLENYWARRATATYEIYEKEPYNFAPRFYNKLIHSISKGYFISLPIFAFFLWLLYVRRKNTYYFVTHAIFAIHFYSVVFIFLLPWAAAFSLPDTVLRDIIIILIALGLPVYLFIAMHRFYAQRWYKTLLKYFLLMVGMMFALLLISTVLLFNSIFYISLH